MYDPTIGRFLSMDPPSPNGVDLLYEHPFAYASNNPVNKVVPSGMKQISDNPPSNATLCAQWAAQQAKKNTFWLKMLPACPCWMPCPIGNPDPTIWFDPEDASQANHPGARWCFRSKPVALRGEGFFGERCGFGQQCCYSSDARLITGGPGAGTPDFYAPVGFWCSAWHALEDWKPFVWCRDAGMLDTYLKYRPPDNRNNCKKNVV